MMHCHVWDTTILGAIGEMPKQNTPEPVRVIGRAYGCKCGHWEFETGANGWQRVKVTPPPDMTFKVETDEP